MTTQNRQKSKAKKGTITLTIQMQNSEIPYHIIIKIGHVFDSFDARFGINSTQIHLP